MTSSFLSDQFSSALDYHAYAATGTDEQQRRWKQVYESAALTAAQRALVGGFGREMNVLVSSGVWCGDCVQQCPLLARIAEANAAKIHLRFLDRDAHADLTAQLQINGGNRVPVAVFMAEDFEHCAIYGERTLSRYRALALKQLGAACPTGIVPPGAQELGATLQEWLNEFERVQLMLRLSPRLRQKHGD
jgi:hypothetical protein